MSCHNKLHFNELMIMSTLYQTNTLSSMKQQSTDRHVTPLRHIILILSQPVFALTPQWCVLSREAGNTNFIVFGLTEPELKTTIYPLEASMLTITLLFLTYGRYSIYLCNHCLLVLLLKLWCRFTSLAGWTSYNLRECLCLPV